MARRTIHPRLNLWATEGSYVLEPTSSASSEPSLVINRRNGQLTLQPFDAQVARMASPIEVRGIMGILPLTTSASNFLSKFLLGLLTFRSFPCSRLSYPHHRLRAQGPLGRSRRIQSNAVQGPPHRSAPHYNPAPQPSHREATSRPRTLPSIFCDVLLLLHVGPDPQNAGAVGRPGQGCR